MIQRKQVGGLLKNNSNISGAMTNYLQKPVYVGDTISPSPTTGDKIHNAISDVATGVATWGTSFRKPTSTEIQQGRGNWRDRTKLLASAATQGLANELIGGAISQLPKVGGIIRKVLPRKTTPSEINWGAWNKEILGNKPLMREYAEIEQRSKLDNTWMKNPDGSMFKGSPEQFVQQNSQNFKNFYLNSKIPSTEEGSVRIMYHGSPDKNIEVFRNVGDKGYIKSPTTTTGGSGIYFTDNKNYADLYQDFGSSTHIKPGKTYETYIAPKTAITAGESILDDISPSFLWNHSATKVDAIVPGKYTRRMYPEHGYEVSMEKPNLIKSAVGNNGMFDVTNPNIYKSLLPILGIGALSKSQSRRLGGLLR